MQQPRSLAKEVTTSVGTERFSAFVFNERYKGFKLYINRIKIYDS
jgi:hypothetical protein